MPSICMKDYDDIFIIIYLFSENKNKMFYIGWLIDLL
jgi:hypothetical protein